MTFSTQPRATLNRKPSAGVIYVVRWERPIDKRHKGCMERVYRSREGAEKCAAWVRSGGREAVIMRADLGSWSVVS